MVAIVDDDGDVREALSPLLRSNGKKAHFQARIPPFPASGLMCVSDSRFKNAWKEWAPSTRLDLHPINKSCHFVTGRGDVQSGVTAMKGGVEFLSKRIGESVFLPCLDRQDMRAGSETSISLI
jgi:FixJ family two-component response regulator